MENPALIRNFREGFPRGYTVVTREDETACGTGVEFGVLRMKAGEVIQQTDPRETAWIILRGKIEIESDGRRCVLELRSLFDEGASVFHAPGGLRVAIKAVSADAEVAIARTSNSRQFEPRLFLPDPAGAERRGEGLVQGACLRQVRVLFDHRNRPESNLVIGEVVNSPGRWSSYPPHHHDQPEIYHYRFTEPQGYGHAELGEDVYRVQNFDTLKITDRKDHAQVSAPGYGMYYLWIVRHLPGNPYRGFEFTKEHSWILDPKSQGWIPK